MMAGPIWAGSRDSPSNHSSAGENRTARGIVSAEPLGADAKAITWRIQGAIADNDPKRGPYNLGGLYGEREGWPTQLGNDWQPATLPADTAKPGVTWYRTDVTLDLPKGQDTSLGIAFTDPPGRHYRAILFVNGWQMGNYIAELGPQRRFPIPNGVIDPHGKIAKHYRDVDPEKNSKQVLADLATLSKSAG